MRKGKRDVCPVLCAGKVAFPVSRFPFPAPHFLEHI